MSRSTRETERKYAAPAADDITWLSDLTDVDGVEAVDEGGVRELDAVYYDTDDLRLTHSRATLRRRTGGDDAGWHLKLPLSGDTREEIRAPLADEDDVPEELHELVLSRTGGAPLRPVVRIRTTRSVRLLRGAGGEDLAELSLDAVRADALPDGEGHAVWTELEAELADAGDPALLDGIDKVLRAHGVERSRAPSKVVRALEETTPLIRTADDEFSDAPAGSAGAYVVAHLERLVTALTDLDPAVRRDRPDAVHRMRTTTRRLRGCLRSYRSVLDRDATESLRRDLRWLARELGSERDHEVLRERLTSAVRELPDELVLGPVAARLRTWDVAQTDEGRRRTLETLASPRYLELLDRLRMLVHAPPLRPKAAGKPKKVLAAAILKEFDRLDRRMNHALDTAPGPARDAAIHQARKSAKRVRYATEAARPALGRKARRLGKRVKAVQQVSGDQHDSVVARRTLRRMAVSAQMSGEAGFTWGLLYGQEKATAAAGERRLPKTWARARSAR